VEASGPPGVKRLLTQLDGGRREGKPGGAKPRPGTGIQKREAEGGLPNFFGGIQRGMYTYMTGRHFCLSSKGRNPRRSIEYLGNMRSL